MTITVWLCDKSIVEEPPVFSTVLKLLSFELTPTGTLPAPQETQVPPNKVPWICVINTHIY
jgi:hypothetical protein